jgi:hypothetical protein
MEHYKDPGNMAYSRDEKSFPARVMTTLWISVPFKTRMSLRERRFGHYRALLTISREGAAFGARLASRNQA